MWGRLAVCGNIVRVSGLCQVFTFSETLTLEGERPRFATTKILILVKLE